MTTELRSIYRMNLEQPYNNAEVQAKLVELLHSSYVGESKHNHNNDLYEIDLSKVIVTSPYLTYLWLARENIIQGVKVVEVPLKAVEFMARYARGVKSASIVTPSLTFKGDPPFEAAQGNIAVMYSGGSESVRMDVTFTGVDLIRVKPGSWLPYERMTREFQLCLLGLGLGYGTNFIGAAMITEPAKMPRAYEFSKEFVDSWNNTFHPCGTIQYPLSWFAQKDETYKFLYRSKLDFHVCDVTEDTLGCGECWHCAERYWHDMALRSTYEFADLPPKPMSLEFLLHAQAELARSLALGDSDPYAATTSIMRHLEKTYGLSAWYKGDPTDSEGGFVRGQMASHRAAAEGKVEGETRAVQGSVDRRSDSTARLVRKKVIAKRKKAGKSDNSP